MEQTVLLLSPLNGKAQTAKIDYSNYVSVDFVARMPKVLSADEYRTLIAGSVNDYGFNTNWLAETLKMATQLHITIIYH